MPRSQHLNGQVDFELVDYIVPTGSRRWAHDSAWRRHALNPDGGLSIGYTTSLSFSVYGRSDVGLQTNVEWPANSDVGFWTDDDGESGTFLFDILDQKSG